MHADNPYSLSFSIDWAMAHPVAAPLGPMLKEPDMLCSILRHRLFTWLPLGVVAALLAAAGCQQAGGHGHAEDHVEDHAEDEHAELAPYMAHMQRFSMKLGYAVAEKNTKLANFYLHELEETAEEIEQEVPMHDKWPIAKLTKEIAEPAMEALVKEVKAGKWDAAKRRYKALIVACNRCHMATEHDYLVITEAAGEPPFNQNFKAGVKAFP